MTRPLFLLSFLFFFCCRNKQDQSLPYQHLQYCRVEETNDSVYCGSLTVWENRTTKVGRKINLNVTVIPALQKDSAGAAIFYLEGGPGVAASKNASFFADKEIPYRKYHDIVLIDIRGTGKSNPLNCNSLQYSAGLQEQFDEMYPVQAVKECYDSLSKIADLTQYTTSIIAEDMDEVRKWLGYKKIHLFGLSYGTKLAQEYMRRFPDAVESVVLFSPVIMNSKMPLPFARFAQNALDSLFADCVKDSVCNYSFPNLSYEFNFLKEKGRRVPFEVDHIMSDGTTKKITISWDAFQTKIRTLLYLPFTQRTVPYIIHETYNGNWKPFIGLYKEKESFSDFIAEGLYLCITCSEDIPFIKDEEITPATANTFMNTYRVDQQKGACSLWSKGTIPSDYLEPVNSTIPVLILSGTLDPVTPTIWAKEIASKLANSKLVIIPAMAHAFDGLSNESCFDDIVLAFIANPSDSLGNTDCVYQMKPPSFKVK